MAQLIKGIVKGAFWLIFGMLIISIQNQEEIRYAYMQHTGIKVTGEIVSIGYWTEPRSSDPRKTNVYPKIKVSYEVQDRTYVIEKKDMSPIEVEPLEEGQQVSLFAKKDDPTKIQLERTDHDNFWAKANTWVGAIFVFAGLGYLVGSAFSFLLSFFKSSTRKS